MTTPLRSRFRGLRNAGSVAAVLVLAGCLLPPSVSPSASLVPGGAKGGSARTGSAFAVAYAGPHGVVADRRDPAITVLFNRSMRAIEAPEDEGLPRIDVRTKEGAPVAGKLRWVGTRGLLFVPDAPLPGATRFVVTVPAETKALDGAPLGNAYSFELTTPRPAIVRHLPRDGAADMRADDRILLVWNQDVAPEDLEKNARLLVRRTEGDPGEAVPFRVTRDNAYVKQTERALAVKPLKPLPLDVGIELVIPEGLRGGEGPLATDKTWSLHARTYGPLRLASFHCPRITGDGRCKAHNDIKVALSNPVEADELKKHIRAPGLLGKPKPEAPTRGKKHYRIGLRHEGTEHWIGADPQMGRKYKVTLTAGMKDVFGQTLARDETFEIEVEPPFVGGAPKTAAAAKPAPAPKRADPAAPNPAIPHRPQLQHALRLGLEGRVVEALATTGIKSHKLPIGSVNIPTYQLTAARLNEAQALSWMTGPSLADFLAKNHLEPTWISPGVPENTRAVREVDLDALLGKPGRGAAMVVLAVPDGTVSRELVRVTDLGVTAKASRYGSLVWVTSISSGKPVAGATVSVRTKEKGEIVAVRTDDRGLAEVPADRYDPFGDPKQDRQDPEPAFLFVKSGDDWTVQPLARSHTDQRVAGSYQDFSAKKAALGMIYTDRGVYRPGETVKVAGLFRTVDAAAMRSPAGDEIRIEVKDASDETLFTTRAQLDRFGAFAADVRLPKRAHLGDAQIVARLRGRGRSADAWQGIQIAAYKASEFEVKAELDAKERVRDDDITFSFGASYLFGGPMAGASAHTSITRSRATFVPPGSEGFVTTDDADLADHRTTQARTSDLGDSDETLDAEGRASRRLKLVMPGQTGPERVTFEAEVSDLSRQTVAQRASVLVHPAELYVGLKAPKTRFAEAGGNVRAEVLAFEPSGARRAGVPVMVELFVRRWLSAAEEHGDGVRRSSQPKDELVGSCAVRSEIAARGCDLKVPEAGYYVMRATAHDPRGHEVHASQGLYAVESRPQKTAAKVAWAAGDTRAVRLETDRASYGYDPGDTARVLVQSPFSEAEALVTVERNGVLQRSVQHLSGPMPVVEIPVTKEMYPNAYVGVHLVRGRITPPPEKGADLGGPEFRVGYAEIFLNQEAHRLAVTVAPDKREHRPGDEVDVDLTVLDRGGKPVESAVTFYAVDEGVLMLTDYRTPDPLPRLASRRRLAVFTAESREDLARVVPMKAGERVPILGWEYASRGDKGYAGGGGEGGSGMRRDFRSTAFFEAGKVTDKEGKARVHFKLPDNLTTFRLMAVAASEGDFFGAGEGKITTSKKLMARPALPRIVRVGDAFEASVVVSSKDLGESDVDVSLDVRGLDRVGDRERRVHVPKGGSVEVRFPVKASAPGEGVFEIGLKSGDERDAVRVTRKVDLPVSMERVSVYGEVGAASAISLGDLSSVRPDQGSLELRAAPTALVGLSSSMEALVDYPYGCTEQLVSRLLPMVALADLARSTGTRLPANVPHAVEEAIEALVQNQKENGGFGFWRESPETVPWLSAWVLFTLDTAKKAGHDVPANVLDSAVGYLRQRLRQSKLATPDDADERAEAEEPEPPGRTELQPEEKERIDYANAAFMADTLASIGAPDPGLVTRLYDARKGKPLAARALVLHAVAAAKLGPDLGAALVKEIEAELRVDANEAVARVDDDLVGREMFESSARTTALVLRGIIAADPKNALAPRIARGLLAMREKGAWRSTQENGWALLALRDYRAAQEASKKEIEARAFLGRDLVGSRVFAGAEDAELKASVPAAKVVASGGPITFQGLGDGPLFYAAELRYASTALPKEARDQGLFVKKLVRAVDPAGLADATEWIPKKSGDGAPAGSLVLVDLLLESSEARRQVVIDDPLPAGLEPIDTALDTTSRTRAVHDDDGDEGKKKKARPDELTGIGAAFRTARVHREMHDDRVLTFIEDLPPGMYHFRYLTRATSIGRFVVPPTRVEAMYTPEVWGSTAAGQFEVKARQ